MNSRCLFKKALQTSGSRCLSSKIDLQEWGREAGAFRGKAPLGPESQIITPEQGHQAGGGGDSHFCLPLGGGWSLCYLLTSGLPGSYLKSRPSYQVTQ